MKTDFAEMLSSLRREKGISQKKAAKDLQISQALLSHYENGVREPKFEFVHKACLYYGVSADYILGRLKTDTISVSCGSPYMLMDNDARGAFIGLTAMHTRRDMLRAVMEGVMYALCQNVNTMRQMGVTAEAMLACGGGAKSPFWRQMMADIFQMPVKTVQNTEGPALGAAILGGVAAGVYADVPSACSALVKENDPLLPDENSKPVYAKFYDFFLSLYPALKDCYKALSKL